MLFSNRIRIQSTTCSSIFSLVSCSLSRLSTFFPKRFSREGKFLNALERKTNHDDLFFLIDLRNLVSFCYFYTIIVRYLFIFDCDIFVTPRTSIHFEKFASQTFWLWDFSIFKSHKHAFINRSEC